MDIEVTFEGDDSTRSYRFAAVPQLGEVVCFGGQGPFYIVKKVIHVIGGADEDRPEPYVMLDVGKR